MERVTLTDVARRVGVSAKTVSNVVTGSGRVSESVRAQVQAAIDELGYRPNLAARQLRGAPSGIIALALPDLRQPYFSELAAHFVTAAQRQGRMVLISQTDGDRDVERAVIESRDLPHVDLIVLSPLGLTADDLAARRSSVPLLLLGEQAGALDAPGAAHIAASNVDASRAVIRHLVEKGRTRIAAIGVQSKGPNASSTLRASGYRAGLADAGIPVDPALLREVVEFTRAEGSSAVQRLIDDGVAFDALFCFNDSLAFGALHTLAVNGIRVPEQVAVVGFDDVEEARYAVPALTSVGPGPEVVSRRVFDLIAAAGGAPVGRHELDYAVVARDSS